MLKAKEEKLAAFDSQTAQIEERVRQLGGIQESVNQQKRHFLRALVESPNNNFEHTKVVLASSFFQPKIFTTKEFLPESEIVRRAADLNRAYRELKEKRNWLAQVDLV